MDTLLKALCAAEPTADPRANCALELPAPQGEAGIPDEILLMPAGEVRTRPNDGRDAWSNPNPEAVIAATRQLGTDLVIDYDHATEFVGKLAGKAVAAGWVTELLVRDGAIWGKVEWTPAARKHLAEREYRYISPTFMFDKATRAIKAIVSAALTNNPALFMKAIATAQGDTMDRKALAAALGLAEDASEEDIQKALAALKAEADAGKAATTTVTAVAAALDMKADAKPEDVAKKVDELKKTTAAAGGDAPDPSKYVPIEQYNELSNRVEELEKAQTTDKATAAVDKAAKEGKIAPAARDWALAYATKDPDGFAQYVEKAPVIVRGGELVSGAQPEPKDGALNADEKAACHALGISEEDFKKTRDGDKAA